MNVGQAAAASGLRAKTIRYYEEIGLISPTRAPNGYRDYDSDDIHRLSFLRRARGLGFSVEECRQLMALYRDRSRASHDVRQIAVSHVEAIEEKIREFCDLTYEVKFPMFEKSRVAKRSAEPLYQALAAEAGQFPRWNFHKYLLNRQGEVVSSFGSSITPNNADLISQIEALL